MHYNDNGKNNNNDEVVELWILQTRKEIQFQITTKIHFDKQEQKTIPYSFYMYT